MATARWKFAALDGTVVWGVYDDVTDEMIGFEIQNPGRLTVLMVVDETGEPTRDVERNPRQPVKVSVPTPGAGKRTVSRTGEIDLPDGLNAFVKTVPTR